MKKAIIFMLMLVLAVSAAACDTQGATSRDDASSAAPESSAAGESSIVSESSVPDESEVSGESSSAVKYTYVEGVPDEYFEYLNDKTLSEPTESEQKIIDEVFAKVKKAYDALHYEIECTEKTIPIDELPKRITDAVSEEYISKLVYKKVKDDTFTLDYYKELLRFALYKETAEGFIADMDDILMVPRFYEFEDGTYMLADKTFQNCHPHYIDDYTGYARIKDASDKKLTVVIVRRDEYRSLSSDKDNPGYVSSFSYETNTYVLILENGVWKFDSGSRR